MYHHAAIGTATATDTNFQSNANVGKDTQKTPKSTIVHGWHQKGFVFHTEEAEEEFEEAFCSKLSSSSLSDGLNSSAKKNVSFSATTFASKSSSKFSSLVFSLVSLSLSFSSSLKKNESFFDAKVAALFFQFVFVCLRRLVLGTPKTTTQ